VCVCVCVCLLATLYVCVCASWASCYLDAVVFGMYARSSAFDRLLDAPLPSAPQRRVQRALLEAVTRLRAGQLVPAALMHHLRWCLADAGAVPRRGQLRAQQDASEFFLALLDLLQAPVLPWRVLLHHGGVATASDDGLISERMLELCTSRALPRPCPLPPVSPPRPPADRAVHVLVACVGLSVSPSLSR
jgi:hypothetical protein